jgi:ligand-binding SRPBCC domain-containing protein
MHLLERDIVLNITQEELWEFLATPANLNELTPPDLHFQIVTDLPERMYNGLIIEYQIRIPRFGNWRWVSEIKHIREGEYFVDEQRQGPYRFWYHQHLLQPAGDKGTRMIDRVSYRLPWGVLGTCVHACWIKRRLDAIFDYRAERLVQLFH